jgi:hypothetical protein
MGRRTKPRFAVVLLMILTVGLSLGLPAEDVLDAVYDESEAVPYEVIPLFSVALRPLAARTTQSPLNSLHLKAGVPSLFLPARVRDADARRAAGARVSLALLCTLLC